MPGCGLDNPYDTHNGRYLTDEEQGEIEAAYLRRRQEAKEIAEREPDIAESDDDYARAFELVEFFMLEPEGPREATVEPAMTTRAEGEPGLIAPWSQPNDEIPPEELETPEAATFAGIDAYA